MNIVSTPPFAYHLLQGVCMRTHDEGGVWDKGKKESRSQCGQVGNDNLNHQNDQAVPDLIDDGSGRKAGHVVACTFDNGTCFGKVTSIRKKVDGWQFAVQRFFSRIQQCLPMT